MNIHRTKLFLFVFILLLSACAKQAQTVPPTVTFVSPVETIAPSIPTPAEIPTDTSIPTPIEIPTDTPIPAPTQDPTIFGAILQDEIQTFLLEPIVNAIFTKVMDGFITDGNIIEYQVTSVTVFPTSSGDVLAEVIYNIHTTDPSWLADGGTPADNNWINDKCNRFDFVTTNTEFQLKNRRACS